MKINKKPKIGRWILLALLIFLGYRMLFANNFSYQKTVNIKEKDTFQTFLSDFSWKHKMQIKRYVKRNNVDFSKLQMGSYLFSGSYSPKTFISNILEWPTVSYHTIRILEWWSIYDVENSLTGKWIIESWEYISFVTNPAIISKYQARYGFLPQNIKTLEWFLYPDTYKVDIEKNIIDQLVYLQLETFRKRVWEKTKDLTPQFWMDWYKSIIMASIVEKEERVEKNRPIVAGILIKRLQVGMLIGADISLCYFFKIPYADCTPKFIARNVADKKNPYNTRTVSWLPPTPVWNPTVNSIMASLQPTYTDYLYYLHDNKGQIYYGKTLEDHNSNKKNYLK